AIDDGRFVEAIEYKKVIEDILDEARRDRETRVARDSLSELRAKVEAHAKFGADVRTAAEILARAEAMIDAGELHEVGGYEELVTQSERLGVPSVAARGHLQGARKAIEEGNVDGFERGLADARASLEESRKSHFLERYEARVHAVSTMMANAKRLGAELGDAEGSLEQAEAALHASDIAMADILIKQAEVSVGIQIQNFIKNKYPNLALRLPAAGLQA